MTMALDIIVHNGEDTNEKTEWGILYEDGSVRWYDSLEEAELIFSGFG